MALVVLLDDLYWGQDGSGVSIFLFLTSQWFSILFSRVFFWTDLEVGSEQHRVALVLILPLPVSVDKLQEI